MCGCMVDGRSRACGLVKEIHMSNLCIYRERYQLHVVEPYDIAI